MEAEELERFARWNAARGKTCVACGSRRYVQRHHVVKKQHVRNHGGDIWDPDNGLDVCDPCHDDHHQTRCLELRLLTEPNLDFAFALLGAYAYDYLRREYSGNDQRLERRLLEAETTTKEK